MSAGDFYFAINATFRFIHDSWGKEALIDYWSSMAQEYHAEVAEIEKDLPALLPGVERLQYAACLWCYQKIREAGGLGLFCHHYWLSRHRYDIPEAMITQHFEDQPFDALELISGYHPFEIESNVLQVARYHEERARGKKIPIVGVSDAHGCERGELFGWYYTVVFAPSSDLPDLMTSIKDFYSVAIETLPGETMRAFGPFRLVKYAQFLLREIFPLHDELCLEEGRLMLAHLAGDEKARDVLHLYGGRTAALYDLMWETS